MAMRDSKSCGSNPHNTKSAANSPTATILVGPDQQAYVLNEELLTRKCPFFDKCLKATYKEGKEDLVHLPEDSPAAFGSFVKWISKTKTSRCTDWTDVDLAVETYVLADKLCMSAFQSAPVDSIRAYRRHNMAFRPSALAYISENSAPNSKLKAFLLDQNVFDMIT